MYQFRRVMFVTMSLMALALTPILSQEPSAEPMDDEWKGILLVKGEGRPDCVIFNVRQDHGIFVILSLKSKDSGEPFEIKDFSWPKDKGIMSFTLKLGS